MVCFSSRLAASCCSRASVFKRRLRRLQSLFQPRDGLGQALGLDRLHEIVEHALSERLHGVLIEGSDKHQMRAATDVLSGLDTGLAGHLHVQKTNLRPMRFEQIDGFATVAGLSHDLQLGPELRQHAFERIPQQRLVVGDECGGAECSCWSRREIQFGADTVRLDLGQMQLSVAAERELHSFAQR